MIDPGDLIPAARLKVMQIINLGIIMSLVGFIAVVLVLSQGQAANDGLPIITYIAAGMLLMNTCLAVTMPTFMVRAGVERLAQSPSSGNPAQDSGTDADHLLALRQTSLIIGLALIEGAGFTAGIAFLIEKNWPALGVAVAALLLLMGHFPTKQKLQSWLERQLNLLDELRQRGS